VALQLADLELLLVVQVEVLDTHLALALEQPDRVMLAVALAALLMEVVAEVALLRLVVRFTTMELSAEVLAVTAPHHIRLGA
jgi:hypothetical protein